MKRIVSLLLALVMICGLLPQGVMATETPDVSVCNHQHDDVCYATECSHVHGECSYMAAVPGAECTHVHDKGCGYDEAVEGAACAHTHDEVCGYVAGTPETPCDHNCANDTACSEKVLNCIHVHDDDCGYVETNEDTDSDAAVTPDEEIGSGTPDGKPPVLHEVSLSATSVTAPGSVGVTVKASDDVSGVDWVRVYLKCDETGSTLDTSLFTDENGLFQGQLTVNQYVESGTFYIYGVDVWDNASNSRYYSSSSTAQNQLPESARNIRLEVTAGEMMDVTPPMLHEVTLSTTSVTAPGTVGVTVKASDDVSGVNWVRVYLKCDETGHTLDRSIFNEDNGVFQGEITVDQYETDGIYYIYGVDLWDNAGNSSWYSSDDANRNQLPTEAKEYRLEVKAGENADTVGPILNNVTLSKTVVTAPGTVGVTVKASDDVSGVNWVRVYLKCDETGHTLDRSIFNENNGLFQGEITVDQYELSGTFYIYGVDLWDNAGNSSWYSSSETNSNQLSAEAKEYRLIVVNTDSDVTTSVGNSDFVDKITEADANAYIAADYSGDATMPKEAFEAIAGTDKTIDLISEGITWRFEGNDITEEIKDIDLKVEIQKVEDDSSASGDAIENELNGNPGVVMKFPENGTLPGKATIQVKVDYAMRQYLGSDTGLTVYYYNNKTGELELIAKDLKVINDTYVEFPITHCSYYVLTATGNTSGGGSSNSCGKNLTWDFDKATGTLTITGTGAMDSFDHDDTTSDAPWVMYRDVMTAVIIEEGVTSVGDGTFYDYPALATVEVSSTVEDISLDAFMDCPSLKSITVAASNETYLSENGILFNKNKTELLKYPAGKTDRVYRIPGTVTSIAKFAFYNCSNLGNVQIPEGVISIGNWAFQNCTGLGTINIPDSVTQIGATAFASCTGLRRAIIGSGIKDLDICVFENCTSLEEVQLPDTLVNIWENTFAYCTSLKRITLPSGMNFISDGAFHDCTALEEIVIGGLKEFYWSLDNCTALKKVTFQSDAPTHCTNAFQTLTLTAYYPAGNTTWTNAKRASFGGNVTWVPVAYSGICGDNLEWVFDAGTLTISGTGAMYDYSKNQTNPAPWNHLAGDITKLVIEEGVTEIGDFAFMNCSVIENASFPSTLTRVGEYAFYRFSRPDGNVYHRPFWSEINQTVRQWSQIQFEANNEGFPGWDTTTFIHHAPIIASGIFGDKIFWELDENGVMEVFGSGDMYEFGATGSPCGEMPVKTVAIGEGITNIGANIFEGWGTAPLTQTFESITIASTVKRVEDMAFTDCKALKTITFTGDAPSFGGNCFRNVTATAYYPAGNATWTDAVMQDYEGTITWEAYCPGHVFGDWVTEGNTSSRTCTLCGYTEHKVTTDSGDVEIEIPEQPDLEVEVDPVLPSEDSYVLVEEAFDSVDNQDQAILKVFDINLKNADGVHVQPNGTVKVKLPLDWEKDGNYKVYRVNDDGTLTDMNAYRQGSHMVFETDHFSLYVIVEDGHQHDYQAVVTAPTCTADGFTTYTCGCGDSYKDDEVASPGHSYDDGVVTTKPTCMAEGVKTFTCGSCGDTKTAPVAKDPENHSFTKYESDKNATCKKNGTKTAKCDYGCGKTDTVTDRGSKLGHKYQGDKCIRCGVTRWNPDTGDKIMIAVATMAVSAVALLVLFVWKKRK